MDNGQNHVAIGGKIDSYQVPEQLERKLNGVEGGGRVPFAEHVYGGYFHPGTIVQESINEVMRLKSPDLLSISTIVGVSDIDGHR